MKAIVCTLAALMTFPVHGVAQTAAPSQQLLCNSGGVICVSPSLANFLVPNPLRFDVQVNAPGVELKWELRDSTGQVIDSNSTEQRMDWQDKASPKQTLHVLDFILKPAVSDRGTITLWPTLYVWKGDYVTDAGGTQLPELSFPVRLTGKTSIVTILDPDDPNALHNEVGEWVDTVQSGRQPFKSNMPLKPVRIQTMYFDPKDTIGITAAAVLDRNPGQSQWYVTRWYRSGSTAHLGTDGGGWAGVSYYGAYVDYLLKRSILALPGITRFVEDPAN